MPGSRLAVLVFAAMTAPTVRALHAELGGGGRLKTTSGIERGQEVVSDGRIDSGRSWLQPRALHVRSLGMALRESRARAEGGAAAGSGIGRRIEAWPGHGSGARVARCRLLTEGLWVRRSDGRRVARHGTRRRIERDSEDSSGLGGIGSWDFRERAPRAIGFGTSGQGWQGWRIDKWPDMARRRHRLLAALVARGVGGLGRPARGEGDKWPGRQRATDRQVARGWLQRPGGAAMTASHRRDLEV